MTASRRLRVGLLQHLGRTRLLIGLVALAAYLPGFWWGTPYATAEDRTNAWGVDDEPPLGPLAHADDIVHPKKEMNPNLGYPMMHPFMVLGVFSPYVGYLFATGQLRHPTVAYPHGFSDPVTALALLTRIAHLLSVVLGVGIVLCAYELARVLWDERNGVAAAIAALLVHPMFYYARNSNVDVPVLFFTAAGLVAFAHIVMKGLTLRRACVFGTLAGLAVATKEPSFASFAFAPIAMLFLRDPVTTVSPWRRATFWRAAAAGAGCALLAYAVGSGMIVDHRRWIAHMQFANSRLAADRAGGVSFVPYFPRTLQGHVEYAWRLTVMCAESLSWPGLALGVTGVLWAALRERRQSVLALSAVGYLAILFWTARVAQLRYVLPAVFVLAVFAGRALAAAWQSTSRLARGTVTALAVAAALTLMAWDVDLTHAMLRDSRYDAGAWIARTAHAGDTLEYFGSEHKHAPMPAWLASRRAIPFLGSMYRADTSEAAVRTIRHGWSERRPRFVELVPDYTSAPGAPYASSCPPAIYRGLEDGSLGYRLAVTFQTPALLPWAHRPPLDYPVVDPPIRLYERVTSPAGGA
jgi:hypothetical protein